MKLQNALVFQPDGSFVPGDLCFEGDRLTQNAEGEVLDCSGLYALPGLVDLHFHGCVGYDFCDGTQEAISAIAAYEASIGVAAICPATMTYPEEKLAGIADAAAAYKTEERGAQLVGINMEGPFISSSKIGAQNPLFLCAPSVDMFHRLQERAHGMFKLVDMAPEEKGALDTIRAISKDVCVSLAHTGSDYDTACAAFEAGARHVTHLFNAMPPLSHRAPGVIGAAFDHAQSVELIADGVHIHPSVVRAAFCMFGPDRLCLISDSMMATGMADGSYSLGGQAVTVRGNLATLENGTIAGSATNLFDCMKTAVTKMNIPLGDAVRAASSNPARVLGVDKDYGDLQPGKLANIILLDKDLNVKRIILRGKTL